MSNRFTNLIDEITKRGLAEYLNTDQFTFKDEAFIKTSNFNDWTPTADDVKNNKKYIELTVMKNPKMYVKTPYVKGMKSVNQLIKERNIVKHV